jgi:hypothetical protein
MANQVLIETLTPTVADIKITESIGDSTSGKKSYFMEGIFIQGDVKNHNGRVYPRREIESAVKSINERIAKGMSILGEVDHPSNLQINLDRVSHVITDMRMDGSNGVGKLKIIEEMPMGRICKTLLDTGIKLGVSSRGTGEVGYDGNVKGFDIVTVDIVAQPSAPEAYPQALREAMEHYKNVGMMIDLAQSSEYDPRAEKYLKEAVVKFIKDLKID